MSHYKSITVTNKDGKHYNIRSVVDGKQLTQKAAVAHAQKNKSFGKSYNTIPEAVKAAKAKSAKQTMPKKKAKKKAKSKGVK